ncbi:MAG: GC-type dockerin domain-anchored protein [Planctomycetota bacterium]
MKLACIPATLSAALGVSTSNAIAQVDLEFRAFTPIVDPGDVIEVGLYAIAPSSPVQTVGAFEAIVTWDTNFVSLIGFDPSNPASLIFGGFPMAGSDGINEAPVPADGDALFIGLSPLGSPITATPAGTLLGTLLFDAVSGTPGTPISLVASLAAPPRDTVVFDGITPNTDVTGMVSGDSVIISCGPVDQAPPFGVLDLDDVDVFIDAFMTQDILADIAPPTGIFDLDDVDAFIALFLMGCP